MKRDRIDEAYENMLKESMSSQWIKTIKDISKMVASDEKDDIASKLMDEIEKYRMNINKSLSYEKMGRKEHANVYNSNIKKSKELANIISDIVDSKNPSDLIKKAEKMIKEFI